MAAILSYLREFPFDVIKIDRSFVSQLETESINYNLIQAMTLLANHLNLGSIVEGIETAEQLELLKQLNCQQGQGYLFARSLPPSEVEALLAQDNWIIP